MSELTQEINVLEVVHNIGKRSKKLQAILLQELEKVSDKDSPEFEEARKKILDETNNFTRSVVRMVFGDIEYIIG